MIAHSLLKYNISECHRRSLALHNHQGTTLCAEDDSVSPLVMIIVQYLVACGLCAVLLLVIQKVFNQTVTAKGWFEYYRSFTIPYIVLAALYYYRVFSETKKQDELIRQIQQKKES